MSAARHEIPLGRDGSVCLRPVEASDVDRLFDWVNQPDSLSAKLSTAAPIGRADHERWFAARLDSPDCPIWIAELHGKAVGQVRMALVGQSFEVDIFVTDAVRKKGIGGRILKAAIEALWREHPEARLVARVRHENAASRRLFERAGFVPLDASIQDHIVFVRAR